MARERLRGRARPRSSAPSTPGARVERSRGRAPDRRAGAAIARGRAARCRRASTYARRVAVDLARDRRVEHDGRHAGGERLERRQPEALVLGQKHEHRGARVERRELGVGDVAAARRPASPTPCAAAIAGRDPARGQRAIVADDHQARVRARRARRLRERRDQIRQVPAVEDRADEQHERLARRARRARRDPRRGRRPAG